MRSIHLVLPFLIVLGACHKDGTDIHAASTTSRDTHSGSSARDRDATTQNGADQSNSPSDIELLQRVRQALTSDNSLSASGKNVKVITRDGRVTLRGTVSSATERTQIEALARACTGTRTVDNQIETEVK